MAILDRFLRRSQSIFLTQARSYIKDPPLPEEGGIKYHGFTYYPRYPDFKDPPYEPTKLFLIKRVSKMSGLNPVEKKCLRSLNVDGLVRLNQHVSIVKNIPEINAMLWKVKHLVKITPIKFVNGLPKDGDYTGTYLRDNGTFMVTDKLKPDRKSIEAYEKYKSDHKFTTKEIMEYLRLRWQCGFTGDV